MVSIMRRLGNLLHRWLWCYPMDILTAKRWYSFFFFIAWPLAIGRELFIGWPKGNPQAWAEAQNWQRVQATFSHSSSRPSWELLAQSVTNKDWETFHAIVQNADKLAALPKVLTDQHLSILKAIMSHANRYTHPTHTAPLFLAWSMLAKLSEQQMIATQAHIDTLCSASLATNHPKLTDTLQIVADKATNTHLIKQTIEAHLQKKLKERGQGATITIPKAPTPKAITNPTWHDLQQAVDDDTFNDLMYKTLPAVPDALTNDHIQVLHTIMKNVYVYAPLANANLYLPPLTLAWSMIEKLSSEQVTDALEMDHLNSLCMASVASDDTTLIQTIAKAYQTRPLAVLKKALSECLQVHPNTALTMALQPPPFQFNRWLEDNISTTTFYADCDIPQEMLEGHGEHFVEDLGQQLTQYNASPNKDKPHTTLLWFLVATSKIETFHPAQSLVQAVRMAGKKIEAHLNKHYSKNRHMSMVDKLRLNAMCLYASILAIHPEAVKGRFKRIKNKISGMKTTTPPTSQEAIHRTAQALFDKWTRPYDYEQDTNLKHKTKKEQRQRHQQTLGNVLKEHGQSLDSLL